MRSKWSDAEIQDALDWYAKAHRMIVFTRVPVTGPDLDAWGPGCPELFEIIAVPAAGRRRGRVHAFERHAFEDALASGVPIHPILAVGYADRPGFGYLATRQAFVARSWQPNGPIQPLALAEPNEARTNVSPAYFSAGFDVVPLGGEIPPMRRGRGVHKNQDPWEGPRSGEDWTLNALRRFRQKRGWWLAEVAVGTSPPRLIDALVVATPERRRSGAGADFDELRTALAGGLDAELIEAKDELNVGVVGQVMSGAQMLAESHPGHGRLSLTVAVRRATDEPLLWFCRRYGIRVEVVSVPPER